MSAGYKGKVKIVIDEDYIPVFVDEDEVDGSYGFNHTQDFNQLDKSSIGDNWKQFEQGLKDVSGSVDIYLENTSIDTTSSKGIDGLISLLVFPENFTGKTVWIENRLNDYIALAFSIVIENFNFSTQTDDTVKVSFSWKGAGSFKYYEVQRTNYDLQNIENYVLANLTNFEIQNVRDIGI